MALASATNRARALRHTAPDTERHLWRLLRSRQLAGSKFRRQHAVGPFIADFACISLRLIIEADGGQHADSAYDARRTKWLEEHGWRVIRFWNNEILTNPEGVLSRIAQALLECAPPKT